MNQLCDAKARQKYCDEFFQAVGAPVVYSADDYREYELPREIDKELTDRPYYWMWVEKTNQEVPPTILRLAFSAEAIERENERLRREARQSANYEAMSEIDKMFFRPPTAELTTLGSFRLDKIFSSVEQRGLYAAVQPKGCSMRPEDLVPWLVVNYRLTRRCDLTEEDLHSVGVCLKNRQVVDDFFNLTAKLEFEPTDPDALLAAATIQLEEGMNAVKEHLSDRLQSESHEWAHQAKHRLERELKQVRTYYQSLLPDVPEEEKRVIQAESARKERELKDRTAPRIEARIVQIALVGLRER